MKRLTTEQFIEKAKQIHGDKYDYSKFIYINAKTKGIIICPIHGDFEQTPDDHLRNASGCFKCNVGESFNTETFIKKAKQIHGDKYDYSLVEYKNNRTKVKIICPEHGIFEQIPNSHLNKTGCPVCGKNKLGAKLLTTDQFIKKAKQIHGDKYDYSLVDYTGTFNKVKIICPEHGIFEQTAHNHLSFKGCPYCNEYKGERKIRLYCEKHNIEKIPQKQFKGLKYIKNLRCDFYLPKYNLIIEYNGEQHYKKRYTDKDNDFLIRKHCDWLKRNYAKKNNINYLVIPYWRQKDIFSILEEELKKYEH